VIGESLRVLRGPRLVGSVFDVEHRDCFESLAVMRDAGGARLIVTSPPYPDARTVEQYGGAEFDTTLAGYGRLGEACFEALVPGGAVALNVDGPIRMWRPELGESERSLIAFEVALDWARRIGLRYVERVVYAKPGVPGQHGPRWRSAHELVHVFSRPGADPFFDGWGLADKSKLAGTKYSPAKGHRRLGGSTPRSAWVQPEIRQLSNVIECHVGNNQTDVDHPAPFSARLADAFVLCYSQPGDVVGDPFVGSGTVALSCHRHGRRFIGGDLGHRERDGRSWADVVTDGLRQTTLFGPSEVEAAS
jgi:DNA modification methylase